MFDELRLKRNIRRLGSVNPLIREKAAAALGEMGDRQAVEPLVRCLKQRCPEAAARALGMLGDTRAVEPLINTLQALEDQPTEARVAAALALGALGDQRAIPALVKALAAQEAPGCRQHALYLKHLRGKLDPLNFGLVMLFGRWTGDTADLSLAPDVITPELEDECLEAAEDATDQIATMLDRAGPVRAAAAEALGTLGDATGAPALLRGLGDPNGAVRLACAKALERLGQPEWAAVVQGHEGDYTRLIHSGKLAANVPLQAALHSPFVDVRESVQAALAQAGVSGASQHSRPVAAPAHSPAPDISHCPRCGASVSAAQPPAGGNLHPLDCSSCRLTFYSKEPVLPRRSIGVQAAPAYAP